MKTVPLDRVREVLDGFTGKTKCSSGWEYTLSRYLFNCIISHLEEPEKETAIEALRAGKVIKCYSYRMIYKMMDGAIYFYSRCNRWERSDFMRGEHAQNSIDWEEVPDPSIPKFKRDGGRMVEDERDHKQEINTVSPVSEKLVVIFKYPEGSVVSRIDRRKTDDPSLPEKLKPKVKRYDINNAPQGAAREKDHITGKYIAHKCSYYDVYLCEDGKYHPRDECDWDIE